MLRHALRGTVHAGTLALDMLEGQGLAATVSVHTGHLPRTKIPQLASSLLLGEAVRPVQLLHQALGHGDHVAAAGSQVDQGPRGRVQQGRVRRLAQHAAQRGDDGRGVPAVQVGHPLCRHILQALTCCGVVCGVFVVFRSSAFVLVCV